MMKETSLQVGERLLHDGDAVAHGEQALDFVGAQNRNGHSARKVRLKPDPTEKPSLCWLRLGA